MPETAKQMSYGVHWHMSFGSEKGLWWLSNF